VGCLYLLGYITTVGDAGAIEIEVLAGKALIRASSPAAVLVTLIRANKQPGKAISVYDPKLEPKLISQTARA